MPQRKKALKKGQSKRVRRFEQEHELELDLDTVPESVLQCERRALVIATLTAMGAFFLWIIAIGTEYWILVDATPEGLYVNRTKTTYMHSHMGLFRMCRTFLAHDKLGKITKQEIFECEFFSVAPSQEEIRKNVEIDRTILEYTKSEVAFSVLSMFIMVMGIGFALYTFLEPRYMFKRLAGGVHFICAGLILVMIEVETNSTSYEQKYLSARHPKGARWSFGLSYYLAWCVLLAFVGSGITFIVCSRKKKSIIDQDREVVVLGR